jgi:hypothetical protein
VAISHVVVLTGALLTLLSVPCALAVMVNSDQTVIKRAWVRKSRHDRQALRILDRALGQTAPGQTALGQTALGQTALGQTALGQKALGQTPCAGHPDGTGAGVEAGAQRQPPIEQIAAELRRLDRQRHSGPTVESEAWSAAVVCAYDEWLRAACRRLDVSEHLSTLDGVDRDIERVRIEAELQTAGLILRSVADRPPG